MSRHCCLCLDTAFRSEPLENSIIHLLFTCFLHILTMVCTIFGVGQACWCWVLGGPFFQVLLYDKIEMPLGGAPSSEGESSLQEARASDSHWPMESDLRGFCRRERRVHVALDVAHPHWLERGGIWAASTRVH